MKLNIEISARPVAQARPRFYIRWKGFRSFVGAYEPQKSKSFKDMIAWTAKLEATKVGLNKPYTGPIVLELLFMMGRNRDRTQRYHTKRPDLDNLVKSVKDALNGIIWKDDSQVVKLKAEKKFGPECVKIKVSFINQK